MCQISLGQISRSEDAGSHGMQIFNFIKYCHMAFLSYCSNLYSQEFLFFHPLDSTWYGLLSFILSTSGCYMSHCSFNFHFLNSCWFELFMCSFAIHISSLVKCLFTSFIHFFVVVFLLIVFVNSLYLMYTSLLYF